MTEKKNPVQLLTDQLADITLRLIETEKERDREMKMAGEWFRALQQTKTQLRETETRLAAANAEHRKLRDDLRAFIDKWSGKQIGAENCRTLTALGEKFFPGPAPESATEKEHADIRREGDALDARMYAVKGLDKLADMPRKGGKSDA